MASLSALPKWASMIPAKIQGYSRNVWNMRGSGAVSALRPTVGMFESGLRGLTRGNQFKSLGGLAGGAYGVYKSRQEGADAKGYAWNIAKYSSLGSMGHHLLKNRAQLGGISLAAKRIHTYGKFNGQV